MNLGNLITAICSFLFFTVGADKFLSFIEPPCSLETSIAPIIWKMFGVLQITGSILIWHPKLRKFVAGFFFIFMSVFTIYHLVKDTYDIGGSASMAFMLGLLIWNPSFFRGRNR